MAQLKDTLITGDLRVTGTIYGINSNAADINHTHGNIQKGGTLQTNDVTIATGDKLVITDSSDSHKVARASISFNTSSTTSFLRNDGTWATPQNTTYTVTVTGTGNTITNIGLSGTTITATKGTHTHSKADITDFPTSMTPASHTHGDISNTGTLSTTAVTPANGDYIIISDSSNSHKIQRGIAIGTTTTSFLANDGTWKAVSVGSHTHGNIQNGGTLQTNDITIANGDKLVVTDSSDSHKVARTSISFDGSTATKALTRKGTWETFGVTIRVWS